MNKYSALLQVCAILFILFLIYSGYKLIIAFLKKNRLSYYSIDLEKEKYKDDNVIFRLVHKFSSLLEMMIIFNGIARTYNKYTDQEKMKKGMDYVSLKILLGFLFILLYLFLIVLYKDVVSSLMILTCFVLGFILVDFYCIYLESKNSRILNKDILGAIIIMNNSYRANRSTEQAVSDVIDRTDGAVKKEFKKILNDIKLGLSVDEAFKRCYCRTDIKILEEISKILSLIVKTGANKAEIFENIEKRLLEEEKFKNEIDVVKRVNRMSLIIFSLLPLLFIIYSILINSTYKILLLNKNGIIVVLVLIIIYVLYVFIIMRVAMGDKNDR